MQTISPKVIESKPASYFKKPEDLRSKSGTKIGCGLYRMRSSVELGKVSGNSIVGEKAGFEEYLLNFPPTKWQLQITDFLVGTHFDPSGLILLIARVHAEV